ncbi:MAG: apolipoprotein N-acyltransferase, partial [Candidatus Paceibacterota bacterium]
MIEKWGIGFVFEDSAARLRLAALSAAILLGVGFVLPPLYPAAFFGVGLFVLVSIKSTSKTSAFWQGWSTGFIFYLLVFANIAASLFPIAWIGIENPVFQWLIIVSAWTLVSAAMAISYGILGWLIHTVGAKYWYSLVIIPFLWVASENLSAWIFSLITIGEGTLFGGHFTLGFVGYLLAENLALLQVASLGGVYALTFLLVSIGVLVAKWWESLTDRQKELRGLAVALFIGFILILDPVYSIFLSRAAGEEPSNDALKVAVISRYVPPSLDKGDEYWDQRYDELGALISQLQNIDLLVFPETSAFLQGKSYGEDQTSAILRGLGSDNLLAIDSQDVHVADDSLRSVATFFSAAKTSTGGKQFLLPFGEYLPYIYVWPMRLLGQGELLNKVQSLRGYQPGVNNINPTISDTSVAVRFCDEVLSPTLYRKQVKNGANVLVNISSLSWFHGSLPVYKQLQNIAKVRAVENGRWYIQSGNMAPAFILDHHGRVVEESERETLSVIQA